MKEQHIKKVGSLIKYSIVTPDKEKIKPFFDKAQKEKWFFEDILIEWGELEEFKDLLILPIIPYRTQFATMEADIPFIYSIKIDNDIHELIFITEIDRLEISELKNIDELSGTGKVLVPFNLSFENFPKKYTISNNTEFFKLERNQILINGVKLILDTIEGDTNIRDTGIKLTGRAAELAARKV